MANSSYWLGMQDGPNQGREIDLVEGPMVIGRDPTADIRIESPAVSRRHARIELSAGMVSLEDLGSSNGTFVNGVKVEGKVKLKTGDRINLGRAVMLEVAGLAQNDTQINPRLARTVMGANQPGMGKTVLGEQEPALTQPPQIEVTVSGEKPVIH